MTERSPLSICAARVRFLRQAGGDASRAEAQLVELLMPIMRREAGRWSRARGTVQAEDLVQEGLLAALRVASVYEVEAGEFSERISRAVRRAMRDHVEAHAQDVHPSYHARRGRGSEARPHCVVVPLEGWGWADISEPSATREALSGDDWGDETDGEQLARAIGHAVRELRLSGSGGETSPGDGQLVRRVRQEIAGMPARHREVLEAAFGLRGGHAVPSRQLAAVMGTSRRKAEAAVRHALEALRERLGV